jgi:hypothetical protein
MAEILAPDFLIVTDKQAYVSVAPNTTSVWSKVVPALLFN